MNQMKTKKGFSFSLFVLLFLPKQCSLAHCLHMHLVEWSWRKQNTTPLMNPTKKKKNFISPRGWIKHLKQTGQTSKVKVKIFACSGILDCLQDAVLKHSAMAWGPDYSWMEGTKDLWLIKKRLKKNGVPCFVFNLIAINALMMILVNV